MSLNHHFTEAERAEYGRKMRARRAAQRAADPVGYAARMAARAAEIAANVAAAEERAARIAAATPRTCLGYEIAPDGKVVRHGRGERPETCERCAAAGS